MSTWPIPRSFNGRKIINSGSPLGLVTVHSGNRQSPCFKTPSHANKHKASNHQHSMKTFFQVRQNNSGGSFHSPAVKVIIEASNLSEVSDKISSHFQLCGDSGRYADYDDCGCCPSCGSSALVLTATEFRHHNGQLQGRIAPLFVNLVNSAK